MKPLTEGQARVLYYIAEGFGAYHLCVKRTERATRDRIIRSMPMWKDRWLDADLKLTEAGRARLPEAYEIHRQLRDKLRQR
jgi:hypothetical protein